MNKCDRSTIPIGYIQYEIERINRIKEEEPNRAEELNYAVKTLKALMSNWKYTSGWDWREQNERVRHLEAR